MVTPNGVKAQNKIGDREARRPAHRMSLGLKPRNHRVFDPDIFFRAVAVAFASQAAFLDAAEGATSVVIRAVFTPTMPDS